MTALPDLELRGDAHIAAASLHLLLAQHRELVDMPFEWKITRDGTVSPFLPVDHPQGREAVRLLATALEVDTKTDRFPSREGHLCEALIVSGRWGGASWHTVVYVPAKDGEQL